MKNPIVRLMWGAVGGVNSSGYTNLVCGPAKGSHTSDPKKSLKRLLLKGIHTVFFWEVGPAVGQISEFRFRFSDFRFWRSARHPGRSRIRGERPACQIAT